jgi:hypothetical protein
MPVKNPLTPTARIELNDRIAQLEAEKGYKICGARNRQGKPCTNKAGKETDHFGIGRCNDHGGSNQSPSSAGYTTGVRAKIKYPDIIQKVEQLKSDRDIFDLRDHIFLMEAVAQTILENATEVEDLIPLVKVIESVTKAVQRLHEIEVGRRYVISVENLGNVIGRVVEVIERHVPDPYLRSLIAADIIKVNNMPIPALDARLIEGQLASVS